MPVRRASESCIVHRANCSVHCTPSCALCSTCLTGLLLSAVGWLQPAPGRRHWQVRASAKWVHRMPSIRPIHSVVPTRTELLNYWRVSTGRVSPWPAALPPRSHKAAGLLERARRRHWQTRTRDGRRVPVPRRELRELSTPSAALSVMHYMPSSAAVHVHVRVREGLSLDTDTDAASAEPYIVGSRLLADDEIRAPPSSRTGVLRLAVTVITSAAARPRVRVSRLLSWPIWEESCVRYAPCVVSRPATRVECCVYEWFFFARRQVPPSSRDPLEPEAGASSRFRTDSRATWDFAGLLYRCMLSHSI